MCAEWLCVYAYRRRSSARSRFSSFLASFAICRSLPSFRSIALACGSETQQRMYIYATHSRQADTHAHTHTHQMYVRLWVSIAGIRADMHCIDRVLDMIALVYGQCTHSLRSLRNSSSRQSDSTRGLVTDETANSEI